LEDVLQQILSRNVYIRETLPLLMSKNTIDSVTEQEESVEPSTTLSSDGGDSLQGVTSLHSESLGINEMSSPTASSEEVGLDELSSSSPAADTVNASHDDDSTSSMEGKSQLRNFLSVAKAKWDNVPQGWMQQRTSQ
jgi:hypothetical protein